MNDEKHSEAYVILADKLETKVKPVVLAGTQKDINMVSKKYCREQGEARPDLFPGEVNELNVAYNAILNSKKEQTQ